MGHRVFTRISGYTEASQRLEQEHAECVRLTHLMETPLGWDQDYHAA